MFKGQCTDFCKGAFVNWNWTVTLISQNKNNEYHW